MLELCLGKSKSSRMFCNVPVKWGEKKEEKEKKKEEKKKGERKEGYLQDI